MSEELTDSQIALLCDIGEYDLAKASDDQKRNVEWLLARGYVQVSNDHPGSRLVPTAKGVEFLGERGAGLNEA